MDGNLQRHLLVEMCCASVLSDGECELLSNWGLGFDNEMLGEDPRNNGTRTVCVSSCCVGIFIERNNLWSIESKKRV